MLVQQFELFRDWITAQAAAAPVIQYVVAQSPTSFADHLWDFLASVLTSLATVAVALRSIRASQRQQDRTLSHEWQRSLRERRVQSLDSAAAAVATMRNVSIRLVRDDHRLDDDGRLEAISEYSAASGVVRWFAMRYSKDLLEPVRAAFDAMGPLLDALSLNNGSQLATTHSAVIEAQRKLNKCLKACEEVLVATNEAWELDPLDARVSPLVGGGGVGCVSVTRDNPLDHCLYSTLCSLRIFSGVLRWGRAAPKATMQTPQPECLMRRLLLSLLVLAACAGETPRPPPALPDLGAYTYASPGAGGTLTLTRADTAVLQGMWRVTTFRGDLPASFIAVRQDGAWLSVEVVNAAPPLAPFIVVHRWTIERGALACTANGGSCTVTRVP